MAAYFCGPGTATGARRFQYCVIYIESESEARENSVDRFSGAEAQNYSKYTTHVSISYIYAFQCFLVCIYFYFSERVYAYHKKCFEITNTLHTHHIMDVKTRKVQV